MLKKSSFIKGFTLIELMIVISIIALLALVALVSFVQAGKSSRDSKRLTDLEQVKAALVLYRTDNTFYPAAVGTDIPYTTLASYLSGQTPRDPKNVSPYVYSYAPFTPSGAGFKQFALCAKLESSNVPASCTLIAGLCCISNP